MKRLLLTLIFTFVIIGDSVEKPIKLHSTIISNDATQFADFLTTYKKIRIVEGGYVNDRDDYGKETYAGITSKYNPDWFGWKYVRKHRLEKNELAADSAVEYWVMHFYCTIWIREGFYNLQNQEVANYLFDTRIHLSRNKTIKLLNEVCCINVSKQEYWVTGNLDTIDIDLLRKARVSYYKKLIKKRPKQVKFKRTWLRRAMS